MEGISDDLVVEILLRLPVVALLRFRCVSKRWRNLIDCPNFVKSQLNHPNKPQLVMVLDCYDKLRICYSELDSDYIENPSPNFKELTIPWRDENFPKILDVVGHCNGLLCCVSKNDFCFLLLNPFTGKHIKVPAPPEHRYFLFAEGFGYDRDSDDYKIVAFKTVDRYGDRSVCWIYSLKSNSWKNIVDFPYIPFPANGVFGNGALHWIVTHHNDRDLPEFIIALNLGNLEYFSMPHPSDYSKKSFSHLGVLDGCLYAIYTQNYYGDDHDDDDIDGHIDCCYDLWVMKEYGLEESWTRLSTYNGPCSVQELLFVSYGNSLVHCEFRSFPRKLYQTIGFHMCKLLVYEPSLVCARSGIEEDKKDSLVIS